MPTLNIATSGIVAQAFRLVELGHPSSFGDDSPQALDAASTYADALDECLQAADWSFASVMSRLQAYAVLPSGLLSPDDTLPWLFALPNDLIALREVGDGRTAWRRDEAGIWADEAGPLRVRFTRRIATESLMPAGFRRAVAARMATLLAPRWGGAISRTQWLEEVAKDALAEAKQGDARQASALRYDGQADQGDWLSEALT